MSERFPVTVAPLKIASFSCRDIKERGRIGFEMRSTYVQTPHLCVMDNTEILSTPRSEEPGYLGESKKTRWLKGWVYLDVLAEKYSEDEFLKRCLDPKLRFEEDSKQLFEKEIHKGGALIPRMEKSKTFLRQEIAVFTRVEGSEATLVRIVTPARIKYLWKGFFKHAEPYIAPV